MSFSFDFDSHPFIIAEMSGNHNGSLNRALKLVDAAALAGADAIKLQTYTAETITLDVDSPLFRVSNEHELWGGKNLFDLYTEAHTPWSWHQEIFARARELGLVAFSTPFDETAVDFLEDLGCPIYKIASLEIVDTPLIAKVAKTGKPMIVSTGAASLEEVEEAVMAARTNGCEDLTLLVCSSSYPAKSSDVHLSRLEYLRSRFGVRVGYSDHTLGTRVALAAIAMGASMIEKHFTLDRSDGGVDSAFSADVDEMASLVADAKEVFDSVGKSDVWLTPAESESLRLRPSLFVTADVESGEVLSNLNVRSVRPSGGLHPRELAGLIGKRFVRRLPKGTPLSLELLED